MIEKDDLIKQSSEGSFLHDHIYHIKENAQQNEADSPMDFRLPRKWESGREYPESDLVSLIFQDQNFYTIRNSERNDSQ